MSVVGNHISASVPNVFVWTWTKILGTDHKERRWYAAAIKNELGHEVSLGVWSDSQTTWIGDTWSEGEVKNFIEENPIRVMVQGDFVAQLEPPRLTHTYDGLEAYLLESTVFDHEPTVDELNALKPNRILEIRGGPDPKFITFVDGTRIPFDFLSPMGKKLKTETEGEPAEMIPTKLQPNAGVYANDSNRTNRP